MPWKNGPLTLYHGCDALAAQSIAANGVQLTHGSALTDFGLGFYTTTNLTQAKNWANLRCGLRGGAPTSKPVVLEFDVDRDRLASLDTLCFVTDTTSNDFWDVVRYCRGGSRPHARHGTQAEYDVVFGQVSLWPQIHVIANCDQVSFHTPNAVAVLGKPTRLPGPNGPFFVIP